MDDARFWMREKQRGVHGMIMKGSIQNLNTNRQATPHSSDTSWEERAFAEDAAGPLGGCIWPPRSYSCNFCGREFRSAQALGGHMNVHRRDRARLKQSSPQEVFDRHQTSQQILHNSQTQNTFVASHVPSQVSDLAYNPNPNSGNFGTPGQTSLDLKNSSLSANGYIATDQQPTLCLLGPGEPRQSKNMVADPNLQTSELKLDVQKRGQQILKYSGERALMHCDKPDISINLNLFLVQPQAKKGIQNDSAEEDNWDHGDGDDNTGSKRRKITADEYSTMSSSSYTKSNIVDRPDVQQKFTPAQKSSRFMHDLDLELRLGERPEVIK